MNEPRYCKWSIVEATRFAAVVSIATGSCFGDVVVHDNTNLSFRFVAQQQMVPTSGNRFNPLLSAADQALADPALSFRYVIPFIGGSQTPGTESIVGDGGFEIVRASAPVEIRNGFGVPFETFPALAFAAGDHVDALEDFARSPAVSWYTFFAGRIPLLGDRATIGWRQAVPGGFRYGWIELEFQIVDQPPNSLSFNNLYQPLRWAYETEPNVPIVVPAPTAIGLLALAGLVASRRQRRA